MVYTKEMRRAAGRKGGLKTAGMHKKRPRKVPQMLKDLRRVWASGVGNDEDAEARILGKLTPSQRTLYGLLKDQPREFLKQMKEMEAEHAVKLMEAAERAGGNGAGTVTIAAEGQHGKVEALIGQLLSEWESKAQGVDHGG